MPNAVTYSDETTLPKVYKALFGNNDLDFPQVQAAIDRLQSAGILFRQEVPEELKYRKPRESGTVATEVFGNDLQTETPADGSV